MMNPMSIIGASLASAGPSADPSRTGFANLMAGVQAASAAEVQQNQLAMEAQKIDLQRATRAQEQRAQQAQTEFQYAQLQQQRDLASMNLMAEAALRVNLQDSKFQQDMQLLSATNVANKDLTQLREVSAMERAQLGATTSMGVAQLNQQGQQERFAQTRQDTLAEQQARGKQAEQAAQQANAQLLLSANKVHLDNLRTQLQALVENRPMGKSDSPEAIAHQQKLDTALAQFAMAQQNFVKFRNEIAGVR